MIFNKKWNTQAYELCRTKYSYQVPISEEEATEMDGLRVQISAAEGEKCVRCWHVLPDVNTHTDHPGLCGRCIVNVTGRGEVRKYA